MPNNSSTGGYLAPTGVAPLYGDALTDFLGDVVAAITGLNRDTAVLPRWQPEPPNLPDAGTDWVAIGTGTPQGAFSPAVQHVPADTSGPGADILTNWEAFDVACSFYGPNSDAFATLLRDGLAIPQNRETLTVAGYAVTSISEPIKAPTQIKNIWIGKTDLSVWFSRQIARTYPILNLQSASGSVTDGFLSAPFNVKPAS